MFYHKAREPLSYLTHFIGMLLAYIGLSVLIVICVKKNISREIFISCIIYSISLIALYGASSKYHYSNKSENIIKSLRKLDHSMIFILIAGSYTPLIVVYFDKPFGYYFLIFIWLVAFIGVILKNIWINMPRILSTLFYVLLGSAILLCPSHLLLISSKSLYNIILSGIFYIIGAIIYIIKKPRISDEFGFHELFHIFVIMGSFFHYLSVLNIFI